MQWGGKAGRTALAGAHTVGEEAFGRAKEVAVAFGRAEEEEARTEEEEARTEEAEARMGSARTVK